MRLGHRTISLVPNGFVLESEARLGDAILLTTRARAYTAACPLCREPSRRVHSRYTRTVADLPSSGRSVHLRVVTRRFCCQVPTCPRRIFAERFDGTDLAVRSRRTKRLEGLVHHLGLALGGRPGAAFATRLMMPVSNDTLLRVVRRHARHREDPLVVAGIDDWAFRRNHRYGSIVVDLERRHIVALLPDREIGTVAAWLAAHPDIRILSRDRGGGYRDAATRALPGIMQVADRWHLLENASAAFLDAVRKSMRDIRAAIGATVINPNLLSAAETLQYQGYLRREEASGLIMALAKDGVPIKQIVRRTGRSRGLVRSVIKGQATDVFRVRSSTLDAYRPWLEAEWAAGCRKGAELWRRLRARGFKGSLRVVGEWATRRRRADKVTDEQLHKVPSARTIARLMTRARNHLSKADSVLVTAIETSVTALNQARLLMDRFHKMIRKKVALDLPSWLSDARESLLASFAHGIASDEEAVRAAITEPWSNGQTEGQVNRLKVLKRQMYGRAKIDLLEARLIGAA